MLPGLTGGMLPVQTGAPSLSPRRSMYYTPEQWQNYQPASGRQFYAGTSSPITHTLRYPPATTPSRTYYPLLPRTAAQIPSICPTLSSKKGYASDTAQVTPAECTTGVGEQPACGTVVMRDWQVFHCDGDLGSHTIVTIPSRVIECSKKVVVHVSKCSSAEWFSESSHKDSYSIEKLNKSMTNCWVSYSQLPPSTHIWVDGFSIHFEDMVSIAFTNATQPMCVTPPNQSGTNATTEKMSENLENETKGAGDEPLEISEVNETKGAGDEPVEEEKDVADEKTEDTEEEICRIKVCVEQVEVPCEENGSNEPGAEEQKLKIQISVEQDEVPNQDGGTETLKVASVEFVVPPTIDVSCVEPEVLLPPPFEQGETERKDVDNNLEVEKEPECVEMAKEDKGSEYVEAVIDDQKGHASEKEGEEQTPLESSMNVQPPGEETNELSGLEQTEIGKAAPNTPNSGPANANKKKKSKGSKKV